MGGHARYTFGLCQTCQRGCALQVLLVSLEGDVDVTAQAFPRPLLGLMLTAPEKVLSASQVQVPTFLPGNVESFFRQARHNVVLENWDAAGVMYRKALQTALRTILGKTGGNLYSQIIRAVETAGPPRDLGGFAQLIRILGNEAAHGDEFSEFEARLLDAVSEAALVHLFTIPGLLKEDRRSNVSRRTPERAP